MQAYTIAEMEHKAVDCLRQAADMCVRQVSAAEQARRRNVFQPGVGPEGERDSLVFKLRAARLTEDAEAARDLYREAIRACCDLGLFAVAGQLQDAVIDSFLNEDHRPPGAPLRAEEREKVVAWHRTAADLYGCAAARGLDPLKRSAQRRHVVAAAELAALRPLEARAVQQSAETLEALAYEVMRDNLTAGNATRLLFKAGLCYLAGRDPDLVLGKVQIFAKKNVDFAIAPERDFLLDVNDCLAAEPRPDRDGFVDCVYHLASVRNLDAWDLEMLGDLHEEIVDQIEEHEARLREEARIEADRLRRLQEQKDRLERIRRQRAEMDKQMSRVR